ncbi:MAG: DPP IV N-terminal domain-containing protein [Pirellulales bacterium]|nr:DPP IV N-terminal domain-containing protein [Pirellulales bacterium]
MTIFRGCLAMGLLVAALLTVSTARGQGRLADYRRADELRQLTKDKVFRAKVDPHWFGDNTRFWYRNDLPEGRREFVLVDAAEATRRAAFDHGRLAKSLSEVAGREFEACRLPFEAIEPDDAVETVRFQAEGKHWKCELSTYAVTEEERPRQPDEGEGQAGGSTDRRDARSRRRPSGDHNESPDGRWIGLIKDHNVHVRDKATGEERALSRDATAEDAYQPPLHWSPDSQKLVALRTNKGDNRKVYLIESSPKDQLQPKLHSYDYLKPGDQIPITKPHLFDVAGQREIPICDELFPNPWEIGRVRWCPSSRRFTFLYNQRGHQVLRIIAVDADTGETGAIVDERSKTFIDYAGKQYCHRLDETHEIIWMSERDGFNHLYLYDCRTGCVKNQITQGPWVVRRVERIDEENRQIYFRAGGIYPEQDPYYVHFCRVGLDGTGLVILTDGNGTHAVEYSPDGRFLIDTYSRVDMPPVTELRRVEDGTLVCELERADISMLLATGWQVPERFVAKGRDDETDIYGVIYRPTTFDPQQKYPVIESIYAGPQGSFVPKSFRSFHGVQAMAELGFVLVQIDGMGTSNRSKAFHDVCWRNLGDSGFPDRILWMQAAAKKYPWMDLSRVGIYGGSAGGQSATRALLAFGDFYTVAVSDCGCHDNRMDKIWWNELWMGWPIGPHYQQQSNVTQADKLQGKLLLIVGELDRNVDPASTMQVVDALIKADKDFDMLVVPGGGHGIAESPYGSRRRRDFFVRHLLGVEPRSEPY